MEASSSADTVIDLLVSHIGAGCSDRNKMEEALAALRDPANTAVLKERGWDLLPLITDRLLSEQSPQVIVNCSQILETLAEIGNEKELLLGLMEQLERFTGQDKFQVFFKPLQILLLRVQEKRWKLLVWVLREVRNVIAKLPKPTSYDLEGKEKLLLDSDPKISSIVNILQSACDFYNPFIEQYSLVRNLATEYKKRPESLKESEITQKQRQTLKVYVLSLLGDPFCRLDVSYASGCSKSSARVSVERIMDFMEGLESDFYKCSQLRKRGIRKKTENDWEVDEPSACDLSIGTFYYLVFAERIRLEAIPWVYTPNYTMETVLPFVCALLSNPSSLSIHKGILLMQALIMRLRDQELPDDILDSNDHLQFVDRLMYIMVFCNSTECRKLAVTEFSNYLSRLRFKCRCQLIHILLSSQTHSGVRALLIQKYKDHLYLELQSGSTTYFLGRNFEKFLTLAVVLPDGVETDLLENSDQVMAILNLLRFLYKRDQQSGFNAIGMHTHHPWILTTFIDPLRKGLQLSFAHFNLELKHEQENTTLVKQGKSTNSGALVELNVGGMPLPSLPLEQRLSVLSNAISTFDCMQEVLGYLSEILDSCNFETN